MHAVAVADTKRRWASPAEGGSRVGPGPVSLQHPAGLCQPRAPSLAVPKRLSDPPIPAHYPPSGIVACWPSPRASGREHWEHGRGSSCDSFNSLPFLPGHLIGHESVDERWDTQDRKILRRVQVLLGQVGEGQVHCVHRLLLGSMCQLNLSLVVSRRTGQLPASSICSRGTKKKEGRIVTQATALDENSGKSKMPLPRILDADRSVMTTIEIAQFPSTFSPGAQLDLEFFI